MSAFPDIHGLKERGTTFLRQASSAARKQLRRPIFLLLVIAACFICMLLLTPSDIQQPLDMDDDDPDYASDDLIEDPAEPPDQGRAGPGVGQGACTRACMLQTIELLQSRGLAMAAEHDLAFFRDRMLLEDYLQSKDFTTRQKQLAAAKGRGIVISAGRSAQTMHAYLSIRMIREVLGSSMPIEVVFNGKKEYDPVLMPKIAQFPHVTLVDASWLSVPSHHGDPEVQREAVNGGWFFKAWVLYAATSFREVLYLDADNTLLVPPEEVFDTPQFQAHGNLFWPDYTVGGEPGLKPTPDAYRKLSLPVPWRDASSNHFRTIESGQILLDRARHADVLEWLWHLNSHNKAIKHDVHGDKDTFEMAFMLANKTREYQQVRVPAGEALGRDLRDINFFDHRGMTQHLPDGRMAFHHRTAQGKYQPYCLVEDMAHSPCRITHISAPLTPEIAMAANSRWWHWKADEHLDLNAWQTLNCTYARAGGDTPGFEYWPGIRCQHRMSDRLPLLPLSRMGIAGQRIDIAFELYLELHKMTSDNWLRPSPSPA